MEKERILLLGGKGRVGQQLTTQLKKDFDLYSPDRNYLDITNYLELKSAFSEFRPDVVINSTMARVPVDEAEIKENQKEVYKVNTEVARFISDLCLKYKAQSIYYGTDYVFDGTKKEPYLEDDIRHPLSVYGDSKARGEDVTLENPKGTVIRIASPISLTPNAPSDVVNLLYSRFRQNLGIVAMTDSFFNPTAVQDIAKATRLLLGFYGIWQVAGNKISPYEMAVKIAEVGGFDKSKVTGILYKDYSRPAPRPQSACLDTHKFRNLFGNILTPTDRVIEVAVRARSLEKNS